MAKILKFKRVKDRNTLNAAWLKASRRDMDDVAFHSVNSTRTIARRSMKPRPMMRTKKGNPTQASRFRYGTQKFRRKRDEFGNVRMQSTWQKGMYSRPGQPPFYSRNHKDDGLRNIERHRLGFAHWSVGSKDYGTGTPNLHEYGGSRVVPGKATRYTNPNATVSPYRFKNHTRVVRYPKRPYMAPAFTKAQRSIKKVRGSKSLMGILNTVGGMNAIRKASPARVA